MMPSKKSFSKLREELDELLRWFDNDDIDVDEAIVKYEMAIKLTNEIEKYLKSVENKIKKTNS